MVEETEVQCLEKIGPSATYSTDLKWATYGLNQGGCGEKPVANHLKYGVAIKRVTKLQCFSRYFHYNTMFQHFFSRTLLSSQGFKEQMYSPCSWVFPARV